MNILKKEFRYGWKLFCLWTLGVAFLVMGGMVKFSGMEGSAGMGSMLAAFPRAVLAMFGMAKADVTTLGGFYYVLEFYAMLAVGCYGISLGSGCVLRESMDKTYEFLFTKPCGRSYILNRKLFSGFLFLTALCILNGVFSFLAPGFYGIKNTIGREMVTVALAIYLVGLFYFGVSALLAVVISQPERAVQVSYGCLLAGYGLSVVYDMDEELAFLRFATPFQYFRAEELLEGKLNGGYGAAVLVLTVAALAGAGYIFKKKDLKSV